MTNPALPTTDKNFDRFTNRFAFYLFAKNEHKEFLLDFLNALFSEYPLACVPAKITDITYNVREMIAATRNDDGLVFMCGTTKEGQIINIELHCQDDKALVERNLFHVSRLYADQAHQFGLDFDQYQPVINISLLKENHFTDKINNYITVGGISDGQPNGISSDKLNFIYIEAPKCVQFGNPAHRLTQWISYLNSTSDEVIKALAQSDELFQKVFEAERKFREGDGEGDAVMMDIYYINESLRSENEILRSKAKALESKKAALESKKAALESKKAALTRELRQTEDRASLEAMLGLAKGMLAKGLPRTLVKEITHLSDSQLAALS